MALLTLQNLTESNQVAKLANLANCSAGGDTAPNPDGLVFLLVLNGDVSSHTVTVTPAKPTVTQPGVGLVAKAAVAFAIGTLDEVLLGPFPPSIFNDTNGNVDITYSAVTSMKIMAVRLGRVV